MFVLLPERLSVLPSEPPSLNYGEWSEIIAFMMDIFKLLPRFPFVREDMKGDIFDKI
jgi:hypothetical protein